MDKPTDNFDNRPKIDFDRPAEDIKPPLQRDRLLSERERTHGDFATGAQVWDDLSRAIGRFPMYPAQRLALCMIFLKISRTVQNPSIKDHWDDIAGYAKLGSEACDG